ncbi:MAG: DNA-directed RNA polymerase subunit delta [Culicoidibacterales bacterium]
MKFAKNGRTVEELRQYSYVNLVMEMLVGNTKNMPFKTIVNELSKALELEFSDSDIAQLYTDLTVDGRCIPLSDGSFDLKERHKFEEFQVELFLYDEEDAREDEVEDEVEPLEVFEDSEGVVSLDLLKQKELIAEGDEY